MRLATSVILGGEYISAQSVFHFVTPALLFCCLGSCSSGHSSSSFRMRLTSEVAISNFSSSRAFFVGRSALSSSSESCVYGPPGPMSSSEASGMAISGRPSSISTSSSWPTSMYSSTCPIWISAIFDASSPSISTTSAKFRSGVAACGAAASGSLSPLWSFILGPLPSLADRSGRTSGDRWISSARAASLPILASFQFSLSISSGSFIMSSYSRLRQALECCRCPGASICL